MPLGRNDPQSTASNQPRHLVWPSNPFSHLWRTLVTGEQLCLDSTLGMSEFHSMQVWWRIVSEVVHCDNLMDHLMSFLRANWSRHEVVTMCNHTVALCHDGVDCCLQTFDINNHLNRKKQNSPWPRDLVVRLQVGTDQEIQHSCYLTRALAYLFCQFQIIHSWRDLMA